MYRFIYRQIASQWVIFFIEQGIAFISFISSLLVAQQFSPIGLTVSSFLVFAFLNSVITGVAMIGFKTYKGIIRYSEIHDIFNVLKFGILQFMIWCGLIFLSQNQFKIGSHTLIVLLGNSIFCSLYIIFFRLLIKEAFNFGFNNVNMQKHPILVYGANDLGIITMKSLEIEGNNNFVVAFIDRHPNKYHKTINGKTVISANLDELNSYVKKHGIKEIVLAEQDISVNDKSDLFKFCSKEKIKLRSIPPPHTWKNGRLIYSQIKTIDITAILHREPICIDNPEKKGAFKSATVLVSGAAGSIGSEICRQLCHYEINKLILLDQAESALHDIFFELDQVHSNNVKLTIELGSIRDQERIHHIMQTHRPDFVFHAAAYKHVPLLENFADEVVLTNVMGTKILADEALHFRVKKFVMISTDKAVNPTNLMGACKRISEMD